MEDFIAGIYRYSFLISELEEFVELTDEGRLADARVLYNKTMEKLEESLVLMAETDYHSANQIQSIAIEIKEVYDDVSHATGLVAGSLVPAMYKYMESIGRIDVTEGRLTLISSDAGFLTVRDNESGHYLHDTHNPLSEAYRLIKARYSPSMENFYIVGSGLGYEAYQLYHQSDGAVKLYLFEDDDTLLEYARTYGVLSLVPEENIEVIYDVDPESLALTFMSMYGNAINAGLYFSRHKKSDYNKLCGNELNRIVINHEFELEVKRLYTVNLWKNQKLPHLRFSSVKDNLHFDEWVIVSAGPSLDENMKFISESKGKRGLIAVNTVLRRLLDEDIIPDVVVAADPSLKLIKHIKGIEDKTENILLIADWVLSWKYAELYKGDICFVRTGASADATEHFASEDPIWDISGTVACMGIETAARFNASRIWLSGQDLAYPKGKHYAKGMPHVEAFDTKQSKDNTEQGIQVPSVDGGMVDTCEAFVWFKKAIEYQISKYSNIEFINLSKQGALIKGTLNK